MTSVVDLGTITAHPPPPAAPVPPDRLAVAVEDLSPRAARSSRGDGLRRWRRRVLRVAVPALILLAWQLSSVWGITTEQVLPPLADGEVAVLRGARVEEKRTQTPPRYTEGTLIDAMQHAWRFVEDPVQRERLKDAKGVGTPATRAAIIEGLKRQGLLAPRGKWIVPTEAGLELYSLLSRAAPTLVDPGSKPTYFRFGQRLSQASDAGGRRPRGFTYEMGWSAAPAGNAGDLVFQPEQRVKTVTEPDGGVTTFTYEGVRGPGPVGTLVRDARESSSHYAMNRYGAAETVTDPAGTTLTQWDPVHLE